MYIVAIRDRHERKVLSLEEYDNHEEWLERYTDAAIKFRKNRSVEVTGSVGGTKEEFIRDNPEFA